MAVEKNGSASGGTITKILNSLVVLLSSKRSREAAPPLLNSREAAPPLLNSREVVQSPLPMNSRVVHGQEVVQQPI
jgi:hypothetical protein